jgi:hypothetical protein
MENISARFIIKFKDDFLLTEELAQKWNIKIENSLYFKNAQRYIERKKSIDIPFSKTEKLSNYQDTGLFDNFMNGFMTKGLTLNYLYHEHPISIFNDLLEKIPNNEIEPLANFYNYFDVLVTTDNFEGSFKDMNNFIFDQLYACEPTKKKMKKIYNNNPIEHIYVKGIPNLTESPPRTTTTTTPVLVPEMGLPNRPISSKTHAATLFDLEFAWGTDYTELLSKTVTTELTPFFPINYRAAESTFSSSIILENFKLHGKKVLTVLSSKSNNTNIDGLLTDNINIQLSSVFSAGESKPRQVVGKEESSLLACLYYPNITEAVQSGVRTNVAPTESGSVILFEISTPPYPLEIQPAIFQLIKLATSLGLIIIEPAGNDGKDIASLVSIPTIRNRREPLSVVGEDSNLTKLRENYLNLVDTYTSITGNSYPFVAWTFDRNLVNTFKNSNSGAIIIGAYGKNIEYPHEIKKLSSSNFDSRANSKVKIYGYGQDINLGFGTFGSTSAASALIAAMAIAIQSLRKEANRPILNVAQMLKILLENSYPFPTIVQYSTVSGIVNLNVEMNIPHWNNVLNNINTIY